MSVRSIGTYATCIHLVNSLKPHEANTEGIMRRNVEIDNSTIIMGNLTYLSQL